MKTFSKSPYSGIETESRKNMRRVVTPLTLPLHLKNPRMVGGGRKLREGVLSSLLALTFWACSGPTLPPQVETTLGKLPKTEIETIVVMGLNDFHGSLAPTTMRSVGPDPQTVRAGGAPMLASHIRALRNQYGNRLVILDAGDQWAGTLDSHLARGKPVVDLYNRLGIAAATLGSRDFDFGRINERTSLQISPTDPLGTVKLRLSEARYPYVVSNMEPTPDYGVRHAVVSAGRLRIGIIGVTSPKTPQRAQAGTVEGVRFTPPIDAVLQESRILRKKSDIVVLIAHLDQKCGLAKNQRSQRYAIWDAQTPQERCIDNLPLAELLKELPHGTVDAVVSGSSHQFLHHWIHGVPVIQSGAHGRFFQLMYLSYDLSEKTLLPDLARIEGPVPICEKIFKNQGDCDGKRIAPENGRGRLISSRFHGKTILPDRSTAQFIDRLSDIYEEEKTRVIGHTKHAIRRSNTQESKLGNLVADAIRSATGADFALVNPGSMRADIEAGPITYQDLFEALPYSSHLSVMNVSGRHLKKILRVAHCGARGFASTSGLKLKVIDLPYGAPATDLNRDGKITHWEVNRLLSVRDSKGKRIQNSKRYTLATVDYLARGGDDMEWVMNEIPKKRMTLNADPRHLREVVAELIQNRSDKVPLLRNGSRLVLRRSRRWSGKSWSFQ